MARPNFVRDTDHMLHDIEKIDAENRGVLTEVKRDAIHDYVGLGFSPSWIARQLKLEEFEVEREIESVHSIAAKP